MLRARETLAYLRPKRCRAAALQGVKFSLAGALLIVLALSGTALGTVPDSPWVSGTYHSGDFKLVHGARAADGLISADDFKVVQLAGSHLVSDIERVGGKRPHLRTDTHGLSAHVVLVGTLGRSPLIDALAGAGRLDVSRLRGQWESFIIATVPHPLPNVAMGLAVIGSDRRGTAFGVYELSQAIGVSPWNWWADVTPERRPSLVVSAGLRRYGPPSVQYRGIFLNDEDWGLQPWAAKTHEPERGDLGPRTYARIFELLLRLKANTLWPAMHKSTRPFNQFPENKQVADDYAVVMGSSHAEPMLRNNVGEWTGDPKNYDYTRNPEGVRDYWNERVRENGRFESIYTLGMRGIHDSPIQGPKTQGVSIEAEHFTSKVDRGGAGWEVIPGLGRTGDSMALFPTTTPSIDPARIVNDSPMLEYRMQLFTTGRVTVSCYLVPTQPLKAGSGLRYAIGLDHQTPQLITVGSDVEVTSTPWARTVLNATTTGTTTLEVGKQGVHTLRIYMVDAGVVLDKIVVDAGSLRPSYLGPKETRVFRMLGTPGRQTLH